MKKVLLTTAMSLMMCIIGYAQTQPDYKKAPKTNEKVIGTVSVTLSGRSSKWNETEVYAKLLEKAKEDFPNYVIDIREMQIEQDDKGRWIGERSREWSAFWKGTSTGKVVDLHDPAAQSMGNLSKAMDKALRSVRDGSRVAIDMVTVSGGVSINREDFKDQVVDALLDKGYKVVAKEYLDKLYEEQQGQQSGIYNERTTVQENNFSAVGYYINVKVTETSLRVQVVNVSTGEYEGNATVNF